MTFQYFFKHKMMLWVGFGSVCIGIAGCTGSSSLPEAGSQTSADGEMLPHVVATSSVLCNLTQQIVEDTVQLTCLLAPGQDPHTYAPTSSDRRAIEEADLVLYGGYGYEPSLIQMIAATNSPSPKVAVFEEAVPAPLLGEEHDHDHEGEDDHDHDDGHSHDEDSHDHEGASEASTQVPDPHVWHDAEYGVAIARTLQSHLSAIAPEHQDLYAQNTEAIANELEKIDQWISQQVTTVPTETRKLVTTHNSFQYYAKAYDFEVEGALSGLSTAEKTSAARLTELVDLVKASQVKAIFAETTTNPQLIETVAKSAGVEVAEQPLFVEGTGAAGSGVERYQQMLVINTCTIVNALGGQCDQENAPLTQ